MLLFRSEEHVRERYAQLGVPTGATLTVAQQWRLARSWYADRMSPGWRRRTPEEAQALFTGLGLTGDFWRLDAPAG